MANILILKHNLVKKLIRNNICSASTLVNAWQTFRYGDIEELKLSSHIKIPAIRRPNDLLVEIQSASVNVIDILMLKGSGARLINYLRKLEYGPAFTLEFPLTFGRDFSGVVVEVGKGVTEFRPGDEVSDDQNQMFGAPWHRNFKEPTLIFVSSKKIPYVPVRARE
uniref:Alcohol dehydrogenase-like N-terminal domain-containing protein n=1 Tax=Strigamia maritima TaxID=126957 RepID=T1JAF2_STRMM